MLEHSLRTMRSAPVGRVVVVLGSAAEEIVAKVNLHGAEPIVCRALGGGPVRLARLRPR